MKILLVDDDAFLRDMYATKFTQSGDVVTTAEDPGVALSKIREDQFDVLIIDMVMPGMTGLELLERVRADGLAPAATYVMLSNQSEASDKEAAAAMGVHGYLVKAELIPSEVVTAVHDIVAKRA